MAVPPRATQAARTFTRAEVASRNSTSSAAVIIDNRVYDVTEFLEEHPGGAEVLLDNAGRDASRCFRDVGHSELALEWREHFLLGELTPAEWRPEEPRAPPLESSDEPGQSALDSLLAACGPPAALALLAAVLYIYLF